MDTKKSSKLPPYKSRNPYKNQTLDSLQTNNNNLHENGNRSKSRFLGVRQRPSGRWVAEIKESSQKLRLWLGTFDKAEEAAMAYDIAARLLRGRNAKTNFIHHGIINFHEEINYSLLGKNPRLHQLLQQAAVTKSHAISSSSTFLNNNMAINNNMANRDDESINFDTLVEETIFCSSTSTADCSVESHGNFDNGLSFGSSKVYSSVVVAPSFSASLCQGSSRT